MTPEKVSPDVVVPSPLLRRKNIDDIKLRQLADSILSIATQKAEAEKNSEVDPNDGLLEPPVVRPGKKPGTFEMVAGERRWRAMRMNKAKAMSVFVRDLSDAQVIEMQLIENGQREDFHPLDEAEGLRRLHKDFGYSIEDLITKLGKNERYVRSRLILASQLCPEARDAFGAGLIDERTALALARVPVTELQRKATEEVLTGGEWLGQGNKRLPMNGSRAVEHVKQHFMLTLAKSPFPRADAQLVPEAGSCTPCPKRTGAQAALFEDVLGTKADHDLCTDPVCYKKKAQAFKALETKKASEKGLPALPDAEAAKVFSYGQIKTDAKYIDLEAKCFDDPQQRTWKQILGKNAKPVIAFNPDNHHKHSLMAKEDLKSALDAAGVKLRTTSTAIVDSTAKQKEREETRLKNRARQLALERAAVVVVSKGEKEEWPKPLWRHVLEREITSSSPDAKVFVVTRRALVDGKVSQSNAVDALRASLDKMTAAEMRGLYFELLVMSGSSWDNETFVGALDVCGVDWKGILKAATSEVRAGAKAKAKEKAAKAAKPKAAAKAANDTDEEEEEEEHEEEEDLDELLEDRTCRVCKCTNDKPCETQTGPNLIEACEWVKVEEGEEPVCSACMFIIEEAVEALRKRPLERASLEDELAKEHGYELVTVTAALEDAVRRNVLAQDGTMIAVPKKKGRSKKTEPETETADA